VKLVGRLPSREIDHFGSRGFTHMRAAHGDVHVSAAELDGLIGGHEARSRQLLVVLRGRVRVATRDESGELGVGEAVEWQEGEWHETRSLEPSTLLIVEGAFE
jgi:mannose-6-phosphate isomerase-like protein (cupin superfamily)